MTAGYAWTSPNCVAATSASCLASGFAYDSTTTKCIAVGTNGINCLTSGFGYDGTNCVSASSAAADKTPSAATCVMNKINYNSVSNKCVVPTVNTDCDLNFFTFGTN